MLKRVVGERLVHQCVLGCALASASCTSWNPQGVQAPDASVTAGGAGASSAGASGAAGSGATGGNAGAGMDFHWTSSGPLMGPLPDATHPIVSVKDPSIVFANGEYHVFATTPNTSGNWSIVYTHFADFSEAATAPQYYFDLNPALRGYHAAPQVFFFRPQNKWYLIFQSGQPQYTTTDDITKPKTWTLPKNFFYSEPMTVKQNRGSSD